MHDWTRRGALLGLVDGGSAEIQSSQDGLAVLLVQTPAGAWRGLAGRGVVRWRGRHTAAVEQAAEVGEAHAGLVRVGDGARRPQPLGNGGEARPHRLLQVARVHRLAPHLAAATQHQRVALLVRESACVRDCAYVCV